MPVPVGRRVLRERESKCEDRPQRRVFGDWPPLIRPPGSDCQREEPRRAPIDILATDFALRRAPGPWPPRRGRPGPETICREARGLADSQDAISRPPRQALLPG